MQSLRRTASSTKRTFMLTTQWKQPVSPLMTDGNSYNLQLLPQPKWNISPTQHPRNNTHTQTKLLFATPKATINKHNKLSPGCLVGGSDRGSSPRPQHVLLIRVGHHKVPPILGWHIFLQRGWLALGISPPKRGLRFASTIIPLTMNL